MSFMNIVKGFMKVANDHLHKTVNSKNYQDNYREKYGEEKFTEFQDKLAKYNEEYENSERERKRKEREERERKRKEREEREREK